MSLGSRAQAVGVVAFAAVVFGAAGWQATHQPASSGSGGLPPAALSSSTEHQDGSGNDGGLHLERVPRGASVVALGDSWAQGTGADKPEGGYLYVTAANYGWHLRVIDAGGGTGYLNPGPTNAGTYRTRLAAEPIDKSVDLVIVQGGINDITEPTDQMPQAVNRTLALVPKRYPNAQVLVVGFAVRGSYPQVDQMNADIDAAAARHGYPWVDPDREAWRPELHQSGPTINHPTTAGHAQLAQWLEADIDKLTQ